MLALTLFCCAAFAQDKPGKRERKKNLVVKEWNLHAGGKTPFLDNVVTYDELGRKIEEIEYASYGQKKRIVYEYEGNSTKCSRQIEYDDKNHVCRMACYRIIRFVAKVLIALQVRNNGIEILAGKNILFT